MRSCIGQASLASTVSDVLGQRARVAEALPAALTTLHRLTYAVYAADVPHVAVLMLEYLTAELTDELQRKSDEHDVITQQMVAHCTHRARR